MIVFNGESDEGNCAGPADLGMSLESEPKLRFAGSQLGGPHWAVLGGDQAKLSDFKRLQTDGQTRNFRLMHGVRGGTST
jgi:hypothetical protein